MDCQWYETSLSPAGSSEWEEPESVLAVSPVKAATDLLEMKALDDEQYCECKWDCHVRFKDRNWYSHLESPKIEATTDLIGQYWPNEKEAK